MEKITRRLFLRSAGSGSAVAFTTVVPAMAAELAPVENPELLALAPLCDEIEAECARINEVRIAARARCEALIPPMPKGMVIEGHAWFFDWCTEQERDCEDRVVISANGVRRILSSDALARRHPWIATLPANEDPFDMAMHRLYKQTVRYEKAVVRAKLASGLEKALCDASESYDRASNYARQVMRYEARTWIGVGIKARTLDMAGRWEWDSDHVGGCRHHNIWAANLLPDVLRVAKGGAA